MSVPVDPLPGTTIYVVSEDPYTALKVDQALRSFAPGRTLSLNPREITEITTRLSHSGPGSDVRSAIFLVPAEQLPHIQLAGGVAIIGYGPAEALNLGIDQLCSDYIIVPWTDAELRYRIRRAGAGRSLLCGGGLISWGHDWIAATRPGAASRRMCLSSSEFTILDLLAGAAGEVFSRQVIRTALGLDDPGDARGLDMRISRLRRRLRDVTADWEHAPTITGRRGRGYQFTCP